MVDGQLAGLATAVAAARISGRLGLLLFLIATFRLPFGRSRFRSRAILGFRGFLGSGCRLLFREAARGFARLLSIPSFF